MLAGRASSRSRTSSIGSHRASEIRSGDPYEISEGHLIEYLPTGERGSRSSVAGALVLDTDPAVASTGLDTGFSPRESMLRAPDISVGNIEDKPGWATKAPPLAVEYADTGQDEPDLRKKIRELFNEGTQIIWVVRLTGPRRVEVHTPGAEVRIARPGEVLTAPGILQNEIPVEALYDREAAHRYTLRNLLQREGVESLDALRDEGRLIHARDALRRVLARRKLAVSAGQAARIEACADVATLDRWLEEAVTASSAEEALR